MPRIPPWSIVVTVDRDTRTSTLVLQEFRLRAADSGDEAGRLVAGLSRGLESAVPLLTSIDDRRDVATVRVLPAGREPHGDPGRSDELDRLVETWQPVKRYGMRIAERSESPPSYYRLAVTESGINAADPRSPAGPSATSDGTSTALGLLWIGVPVGTHAGLLTLLGGYDEGPAARPDPADWPLPFSRALGVRIYESRL